MAKSNHQCPQPVDGKYQWPCRVCNPKYYAQLPNVRWYLILLSGCVEPELHGPYRSEYGMEKVARRMKDKGEYQDDDAIMWQRQEGQRLMVGSFSGGFFEKANDE